MTKCRIFFKPRAILVRRKQPHLICFLSYPLLHRDFGNLDGTQLQALKEFLPTDEERSGLEIYLKKGEASEKAMEEAMAALSECEKYMVALKDVKKASAKFDCMLFKSQFQSRYDELIEARDTVKKACEEVRSSEKVRKMMATILTLVNEINTGGSGNMAVGFSLDALLKLNEVRQVACSAFEPLVSSELRRIQLMKFFFILCIFSCRQKRSIRKLAFFITWRR